MAGDSVGEGVDKKYPMKLSQGGIVKIPPAIAKALIAIQAELEPMVKTAENDSFGSSYVPLEDVTQKAHMLLSAQGVGVTQSPITDANGHAALETTLFTAEGETYTRTTKLAMSKVDPQAHGSAITYTRRYALMSILGLTGKGEDDDGNKASGVFAPITEEQKSHLRSLMKHLKYPTTAMANEIFNIKTRDHAYIAIKNFEKTVAMKARDEESKENASEVEFGKKIAVRGDKPGEDEAPADTGPTSFLGFEKRLRALNLASPSYANKVIARATKAPFLVKVMEKPDRIEALDVYLKQLESGIQKLPAEFYAPTEEPIVVDEDVA